MLHAWIENNAVRDLCAGDPAELFHPDVAQFYSVEVPDGTERGATLVKGVWTNPAPVAPVPAEPVEPVQQYLLQPTRPQFLLLFTAQERGAIRKSDDDFVKDFLSLVNDPALTEVDLSLASVQEGLAYLVTIGLLTEARRAVIARGWPL